ncbi:MAG: hypothetical protein IJ567_01350 [Lachnospiraceae bacterium]|nr:hypothetical protein [Lachnospiraceae bacterium]
MIGIQRLTIGRCLHDIVLFGARLRYAKNAAVLGLQNTQAKDRRFSSAPREYDIVQAAVDWKSVQLTKEHLIHILEKNALVTEERKYVPKLCV